MPVHALAAHFDISRPAISRHLRVLREAGIVREEKAGRENLYALRREQLDPALSWITRICPADAAPAKPAKVEPKTSRPPKPRTVRSGTPPVAPQPPAPESRQGQMEFDL
jgi:Predicted transcriptional regulators